MGRLLFVYNPNAGKGQARRNLSVMLEALGEINKIYINKSNSTKYALYMESELEVVLLLPCINLDNRKRYWTC